MKAFRKTVSRRLLIVVSVLALLAYVPRSSAEDKRREYMEGSYCRDIKVFDETTTGEEGSFACVEAGGGTQAGCYRDYECVKKSNSCQSDYILSIYPNGGINSQESCIKYCEEIRPELTVVSFRRHADTNQICCACSSRGYPGQYCHSDVKCVVGASFCCEGSSAPRRAFAATSAVVLSIASVLWVFGDAY